MSFCLLIRRRTIQNRRVRGPATAQANPRKGLQPRTKPVETNRENPLFFPVIPAKTETAAK